MLVLKNDSKVKARYAEDKDANGARPANAKAWCAGNKVATQLPTNMLMGDGRPVWRAMVPGKSG